MFNDIAIERDGVTRTIPSGQVMPLIAKVERVITLAELNQCMQDGKPPMASIAIAYGVVLRHAGFAVSDQEVYCEMFSEGDSAKAASDAVTNLLILMVPPTALAKDIEKAAGNGSKKKGQRTKA